MSANLRLSIYSAIATLCAASSLSAVFAGNDWVVPVVVAVILVSGSCALVRHSPLPALLEPVVAALAVLCWVTVEYARADAHLDVFAGRASLRDLGSVARSGFSDIHRLPTPVPTHDGLVMLAVIGVAAIALIVDLMAVTLRRAALAGLPLLTLFSVCAATARDGVGVVPFVLAAAGYLLLLYADSRETVARWGAAVGAGSRARPASAWSSEAGTASVPGSQSRRIGAAAVCLAVAVPVLIPGLHAGVHAPHTGDRSTGGNVTTINPIVSVATDLNSATNSPVLSYRSTSPDPGYLRLTSLDMFNGTTFSAPVLRATASASPSEDLPVTRPPGREVTTTVTADTQTDLHWLPVPTTLVGTDVGDRWRYDTATATVFSASTTTSGLSYTTRSVPNNPSLSELTASGTPDRGMVDDLTVPKSLSPKVAALTRRVTAGTTNDFQAALAIQRFFTDGRFAYDTTIPADTSADPLGDFLFTTKRGFCQQFATAMAVMARLRGIPSRVAVGFTRGVQQPDGSWLVKTHDAHAWPELWFQDAGWLAFEPTPRGDGQAVAPPYTLRSAAGSGRQSRSGHPTNSGRNRTQSTNAQHPAPPLTGPSGGGATSGSARRGSIARRDGTWALALVALAALLAPGLARQATRRSRRRRLRSPALAPEAAWGELRDTAIDLALPWDDSHSPRRIAQDLGAAIGAEGDARAALDRLRGAEERARYALSAGSGRYEPGADLDVVRTALIHTRSARERARAVVLPRSTLATARDEAARVQAVIADRFRRTVRRAAQALRPHRLHERAARQ
ncbi:MAG TPA: DUF3488 and transglutaminase-like domain-containing protein [Mycobacteriales bacterium]|nr:DUF3488 and transglutaminase-like domain-containing protein [Mycobacteriales bacterium]